MDRELLQSTPTRGTCGRAHRSTGRRRIRSRSWARRATCPIPAQAPLQPASAWASRRDDSLFLTLRIDESEPKLVENRVEQLLLIRREIAFGLLFEQRQDVDHLPGSLEIDGSRFGRARLQAIAEMNSGRRSQRQHERGEVD